nr:uncharacterized protein LOC117846432 isoform X2 [Setaria viridis]
MAAGDSPSTGASTSDRTDHDSKRTNCNTEERPNALSLKDNGTDRTGLEPFCEAMQNVPLFDFIWTIEGFSLLPKLERHFSETFDSNGLKWGLFLKPWCTIMNDTRYPSLTLYLEDWPGDLEKSGDLAVWCRITIFNQGGCGEDQQFTHTVDGVFARRRDGRWSSIDLLSYDRPDRSLQSSSTSRFRCTIRGLSTEQQLKPCICKKFSSGGYDWIVCVLVGSSHLHVYVHPSLSHICCQLFGRINIRLINQLNGKHIDKSYRGMFNRNIYHGCAGVVALQTLFDKEEGFLVQDCCIVEVEVTVLSRF